MDYKESLELLKKSEVFLKWKTENEESYLAYLFLMESPNIKEEWQFGYYVSKKKRITAFSVSEDNIIINPESEEIANEVRPLKIEEVRVSFDEAMETAKDVMKKYYPNHTNGRKIVMLQNLDIGLVWNITFITPTFKTINIKIDATTKEVKSHTIINLFRFE